jgi:hypothetical protein
MDVKEEGEFLIAKTMDGYAQEWRLGDVEGESGVMLGRSVNFFGSVCFIPIVFDLERDGSSSVDFLCKFSLPVVEAGTQDFVALDERVQAGLQGGDI